MSFKDYTPMRSRTSNSDKELFGPTPVDLLTAALAEGKRFTDDVPAMLASAKKPIPWVFPDFIVEGDQLMIAGPPKSCKSWIALQLAIAAASGGTFLRWTAARRLKTLYLNLEVGAQMWNQRVIKSLGGDARAKAMHDSGTLFLESCSTFRTIDALNPDMQRLFAQWVKVEGFEFVVFDVLSRCHSVDENLNGDMQRVLLNLRLFAPGATTVVIHHARKPPQGSEYANLGAASIRGASSIVGEVDMAIVVAPRAGQGPRYSMSFAARNVEMPDEIFLDLDEHMRVVEHEGSAQDLDSIIQTLFKGGHSLPRKDVQQAIANGLGVAFETARKSIKGAVERGLIAESRQGRNYFYYVPKESPVLRVVNGGYDTPPGLDYDALSNGE